MLSAEDDLFVVDYKREIKTDGTILSRLLLLKKQGGNKHTMKLPRHLKYGAISVGLGVFGALFGWAIFPAILKAQLKKEMSLAKNTDMRAMWTKVPFALDFKVYLFNYTNAEEVQQGAMPIVEEIGPYYFEEWKQKVEMSDQEDEDTITYKKLDTFYFRKEKSGKGITGEEIIVMPHIFMMSMALIVDNGRPAMLNLLGKAYSGIFDDPKDMFMRVPAMDLMFRGVILHCDRTEFAPKAVCTTLRKEGASLEFSEDNKFRFTLFGLRNATADPKLVKVSRGIKNIMDVGKVLEVDGQPEMSIWRDHCNKFEGTDGTIFPPFLTSNDRLQSYSGDVCRTFRPWFEKRTTYMGLQANHYVANIGDLANDPELNCFCEDLKNCPLKGSMNLMKCLGAPLIATLPHYLDADPSFLQNVKGLKPDPEKHGIYIDFEPITGTPLEAKTRLQFSIELRKIEKLELCKTLPGTIAPLFWVEEGLSLNRDFIGMMKKQLFIPKRIVNIVKWLFVAVGIIGGAVAGIVHFKDRILQYASEATTTSPTKVKPSDGSGISMVGDQTTDGMPTARISM